MKKSRKSPGQKKAAGFLMQQIAEGRFQPGTVLPTIKVLAEAADVSLVTMWKAVGSLREQKILGGEKNGPITVIGTVDKDMKSDESARSLLQQSDSAAILASGSPWQRIRQQIEKDILAGRIPVGQVLPSVKELKSRYQTSYKPLKKALLGLVEKGLLGPHKRGYYVAGFEQMDYSLKIVFLVQGPRRQRIDRMFGVFGEELARSVENGCKNARLKMEISLFEFSQSGIVLYDLETGKQKAYTAQNTEDVAGFAILEYDPNMDLASLTRHISICKRPVAIIDCAGCVNLPKENSLRIPVAVFPVVANYNAACMVARFLLGHGHKKVAYISPFHKASWSKIRYQALSDTYSLAGYPKGVSAFCINEHWSAFNNPALLHSSERIKDVLHDAAKRRLSVSSLFGDSISLAIQRIYLGMEIYARLAVPMKNALSDKQITAVVCANDETAYYALDYMHAHKMKVPKKVSLIGFDNSSRAVSAGITSYNFNISSAIFRSIRFLLDNQSAPWRKKAIQVLPVEGDIVERDTTRQTTK